MVVKNFIFVNQSMEKISIDDVKKAVIGTVSLLSSESTPFVKKASKIISETFHIPIQQSDLLHSQGDTMEGGYDYPGFKLVKEAQTDTVIVIGNGTFLYTCLAAIIRTEKIKQEIGSHIPYGHMRVLTL
jgi:hypothetical protein